MACFILMFFKDSSYQPQNLRISPWGEYVGFKLIKNKENPTLKKGIFDSRSTIYRFSFFKNPETHFSLCFTSFFYRIVQNLEETED